MNRRRIAAFATAAFAAAVWASPTLRAQDSGPGHVVQGEGGMITALVLDPTSSATIYATTARGLYKTTDGGRTWTARGDGLGKHSVLAIAVDPVSHGSVFVATDTGGVFRSGDGGAAWSASNSGLATRWIGAVAFDPRTPGVVYAGTEAGRLFKSTDGGHAWSEMKTDMPQVSVSAITVDPADSNVIYVGTNSQGIFKTSDGGATWIRPTDRMKRGSVWNITVSPASASVVYAGTHDGLFRSSDGGLTWTGISKGMKSYNVLAVAIDPTRPQTIYAATAIGVHKSSDGGASWSLLQNDLYVSALVMDPHDPNLLYEGTHLGVMKSDDGGAKWTTLDFAKRKDDTLTAGAGAAGPLPNLPMRRGTPQVPGVKPAPVQPPSPEVATGPRVTRSADPDDAAPVSTVAASPVRREPPLATGRNTLPAQPLLRPSPTAEVASASLSVANGVSSVTRRSPVEPASQKRGTAAAGEVAVARAAARPTLALRRAWAQATGMAARPVSASLAMRPVPMAHRFPVTQASTSASTNASTNASRTRAVVSGGR